MNSPYADTPVHSYNVKHGDADGRYMVTVYGWLIAGRMPTLGKAHKLKREVIKFHKASNDLRLKLMDDDIAIVHILD